MPDGLVREAQENHRPVIHVAVNYRLGCKFGQPLARSRRCLCLTMNSLRLCPITDSQERGQ